MQPGANTGLGRLKATKQIIHIPDYRAEPAYTERDPFVVTAVERFGTRTSLSVPMLKEGELVGAFSIYRTEVRPFSDKQIELIASFASQAVIAIENARLLNELRQRTTDLTELLEQQTATSEVLRVISSSPGDLDPVFAAMLENAVRICDASFGSMQLREGDGFRRVALHNAPPEFLEFHKNAPVISVSNAKLLDEVLTKKQVVHVADLRLEDPDTPLTKYAGARSLVVVPLLKEGEFMGAFGIYRQEVRPFTDKQIELVQNFAAQAVIAIENTRLLNELRQRTDDLTELLEQQTATSEVLQVISSSPGETERVFETMLAEAIRICAANFGHIYRRENEGMHLVARYNTPAAFTEFRRARPRSVSFR